MTMSVSYQKSDIVSDMLALDVIETFSIADLESRFKSQG